MRAESRCVGLILLLTLALLAACDNGETPILPPSNQTSAGGVIAQPVSQAIPSSSILTTLPSVADIVEMIRPSVVNITTQYDAGSFLFRRSGGTSNGSGAIIHSDGYVVTNYHVISNADRIQITTDDGRVFRATVVGSDPATDLAVL